MSKILDSLEETFRDKVIEVIRICKEEHGITMVPTSGLRTIAEQDKLYAQGRTTKGSVVTKAKGGQSPHNFQRAVDCCPTDSKGNLNWNAKDSVWKTYADVAASQGLVAGYYFKSFKDMPHIESKDWKIVQAQWKEGKIKVA